MNRIISIRPVGHRVLVKPDEVEEKTSGGIILAKDTVKQEQQAQVVGTVIDLGPDCWMDTPSYKENGPWCKIGDRVIYAAHSGKRIWDAATGEWRKDLLLLNDLDITAVVTEEESING